MVLFTLTPGLGQGSCWALSSLPHSEGENQKPFLVPPSGLEGRWAQPAADWSSFSNLGTYGWCRGLWVSEEEGHRGGRKSSPCVWRGEGNAKRQRQPETCKSVSPHWCDRRRVFCVSQCPPTGVTDGVSSVRTSASAGSSIIFKPMSSERASRRLQREQQYTIGVEVDSFAVLLSIHLLFPLRLDLSRLEETAHPFLYLCWLRSP